MAKFLFFLFLFRFFFIWDWDDTIASSSHQEKDHESLVTAIFMYMSCIASLVWWYFIKSRLDRFRPNPLPLITSLLPVIIFRFWSVLDDAGDDEDLVLETFLPDIPAGIKSINEELSGGVARQDQGSKPEWNKSNIHSLPEVVDSIDS